MADQFSFDVVSQVDMQEIDNAVNQTRKEVAQRYDFKDTNTQLVASDAPLSARRLAAARARLPVPLRPVAAVTAARLAERLPGGRVYTDDVAPVEWLIDASIVSYAAEENR